MTDTIFDSAHTAEAIACRLAGPTPLPPDKPWLASSLTGGPAGISLLHSERARLGRGTWESAHAWLKAASAGTVSAADNTGLYLGVAALTFALDAKATLPPSPPPAPGKVKAIDDPSFKTDPALVEKGKQLFVKCVICHGVSAVAGGYAPDLRASPIPLNAAAFKAVVHDGGLQPRGMPPFSDLSDQDLLALQNYIRDRARYEPGVWDQVMAIWNYVRLMVKMELVKRGWID